MAIPASLGATGFYGTADFFNQHTDNSEKLDHGYALTLGHRIYNSRKRVVTHLNSRFELVDL